VIQSVFGDRRAIDPHHAGPYTAGLSERVAQVVEHVTFNHGVEGSSPSALTIEINSLLSFFLRGASLAHPAPSRRPIG
jgi:hypothetical protein